MLPNILCAKISSGLFKFARVDQKTSSILVILSGGIVQQFPMPYLVRFYFFLLCICRWAIFAKLWQF